MKVLQVITKGDLGGAQKHVLDLSLYLQSKGHEVLLVVGREGKYLANAASLNGLKWRIQPSLQHAISFFGDRRAVSDFTEIAREFKPDLIHGHSSKGGLLSRLVGAKLGIPSVYTAHGWPFTPGAKPLQRLISLVGERYLARKGQVIISVSSHDHDLAKLANICPKRLLVKIENGIPDVVVAETIEYQAGEPLKLVMVARFASPKLQQLLIESIKSSDLNVEVTLAGGGEQPLKKCQQLAEGDPRFHLVGEVNDIPALLATQHAFILLSRHEGLSIGVLEALRQGLPVIASRVGGLPELVEEQNNGLLVDNQPEQIINAIRQLIDQPESVKQMGQRSRQRYLERFSVDVMGEKTLAAYNAAKE